MTQKRTTEDPETVELGDADYDVSGMPTGKIALTWRTYELFAGKQSCWVAEIDNLPGYWGEGASVDDALMRLRQSLGPRPHFRVQHEFRTPARLEADIVRKHKALAAAALTFAPGTGLQDETAKTLGIGKSAVTQARKDLAKRAAGVSPEAIKVIARYEKIGGKEHVVGVAKQNSQREVQVAREAPWRIEHEEARSKFPKQELG